VEVVYDIMGMSGHNHTVTVSPANFADIEAGMAVMIVSSSTNHSHTVTVSCS